MIRVDQIWLVVEPMDMRAGSDTALVRVVKDFGAARPHHAYLFANRRANRLKILVHDGLGVWLAARRLNQGRFVWPRASQIHIELTHEQLQGLVIGLPWSRLVANFAPMSSPSPAYLEHLDAHALRALLSERDQQLAQARQSLAEHEHVLAQRTEALVQKEALIARKDQDIGFKQATIAKLTHEVAVLRRFQFGKKSERIRGVQGSLLEETVSADIAAIEEELKQLSRAPKIAEPREYPKRTALPPQLPRIDNRTQVVAYAAVPRAHGVRLGLRRFGLPHGMEIDHMV